MKRVNSALINVSYFLCADGPGLPHVSAHLLISLNEFSLRVLSYLLYTDFANSGHFDKILKQFTFS